MIEVVRDQKKLIKKYREKYGNRYGSNRYEPDMAKGDRSKR